MNIRESLHIGGQSGLTPSQVTNNPMVKLGKVISVHPEDGSLDVMLLDSVATITVPVLSGFMGSNFGISGMMGPSYNKKQPAKKTYPQEDDADTEYSPTSSKKVGRDTYAVVLQLEGNFLGTADSCVIGFMPSQVSEMLFARHDMEDDGTPVGEEGEFDDMLLMRHPSDLQITMDKKSKMSVQLPNGTRITMGKNTSAVALTKKDYDKRYELRENTKEKADVYVIAVDAAGKKRADMLIAANGTIRAAVYESEEKLKADLVMKDSGHLEAAVYDDDEEQVARVQLSTPGNVEVYAAEEITLHNDAGCEVVLKADGDITVDAPNNIHMTAGSDITMEAGGKVSIEGGTEIRGNAPMIYWN